MISLKACGVSQNIMSAISRRVGFIGDVSMTSENKPVGNETTMSEAHRSSSGKAAKSSVSDERERHFLDLIEDDEVREALRLNRQPARIR